MFLALCCFIAQKAPVAFASIDFSPLRLWAAFVSHPPLGVLCPCLFYFLNDEQLLSNYQLLNKETAIEGFEVRLSGPKWSASARILNIHHLTLQRSLRTLYQFELAR